MFINSWLNVSQLKPLGITEEHIFLLLLSIGIIISYFVVYPFINWIVTIQSTKLITYIISSLLIMVCFFIVVLFVGDLQYLMIDLLKITLQTLAAFGIVLILFYSYKRFIKNVN
ncbi:membrane-bound ClpP family serine protease [Virgibacillus natechei]|uniref:Membrane-bound ClpP family serine protease n=1 Tax=Virgibacillus natechei TaxID=1216297 RepID=A0ABS4IBG3_9BACI|nr:membrane-bound ClpP family serine protease [Virgibacillus natechei]